jgi:putative membrane protein insertion efficiency factor
MDNQSGRELPLAVSPDLIEWLSPIAAAIIWGYRAVLSPIVTSIWGPACRFEPSCSAFAAEAIVRHGMKRGGWMALKRLVKCQPWGSWGFDPVPRTVKTN